MHVTTEPMQTPAERLTQAEADIARLQREVAALKTELAALARRLPPTNAVGRLGR